MAKKNQKLSLKEQRFVDAFLGSCAGNGTQAVRVAGYACRNANVAAVTANELLRKPKIQAAIKARNAREEKASILTADERDELLSGIARDKMAADVVRISAVKELNKCTGRHSIKHQIEGKLTLEEVLAESRT